MYSSKTVIVNDQEYLIQYLPSDNKNAVARVRQKLITIKIPKRWPNKARLDAAQNLEKRMIKKLLYPKTKINPLPQMTEQHKKIVAKVRIHDITNRVLEFNNRFFRSKIGKIRIKHNITNWGSCSSKNNINLNFTLLFMPQELLDYVIIHELAHTKVRNHSQKFWQIVEQILSDYKQRKKEIKRYLLTN